MPTVKQVSKDTSAVANHIRGAILANHVRLIAALRGRHRQLGVG